MAPPPNDPLNSLLKVVEPNKALENQFELSHGSLSFRGTPLLSQVPPNVTFKPFDSVSRVTPGAPTHLLHRVRTASYRVRTMSATVYLLFIITLLALGGSSVATVIKAENSCHDPIWIAVVSAPDSPELPASVTGFALFPGESFAVSVPSNWSGSVWARTRCSAAGGFLCLTGDRGSGSVPCPRGTPVPPRAATVAHFSGEDEEYEFYVSAAAGFNLAVSVAPEGGTGPRCGPTGCVGSDPGETCPEEHRVVDKEEHGEIVGCKSSVSLFDEGGVVVSPTFACFSANYDIRFCAPAFTSRSHAVNPPPFNPGELGFEKEYSNSKGLAWKIALGSLGCVITAVIWWVVTGGCCNGPITLNCFNFNNGASSITPNPNDPRTRELSSIEIEVSYDEAQNTG